MFLQILEEIGAALSTEGCRWPHRRRADAGTTTVTLIIPETTPSLVAVHGRRAVALEPDEVPLSAVGEERVPCDDVVYIPVGIPPLLRRQLVVVVRRDGRSPSGPYGHRRDRDAVRAQLPPIWTPAVRRAGVAGGGSFAVLCNSPIQTTLQSNILMLMDRSYFCEHFHILFVLFGFIK